MKGYIEEPTLFGHAHAVGFGSNDFYVKEIDRQIANDTIVMNHYSKKIYAGSYIHLGVFMEKRFVGVLQYGYAMNPASCGSVVTDTEMNEYLELNRMWLDDDAPRNSESMAIAYSIKYIRKRFPKIKWIQSFADERCNRFGVVYQAANFDYYGEHNAIFWTLDGEVFHNSVKTSQIAGPRGYALLNDERNKARVTSETLRQFRYIYFIDKRERKNVKLKRKEYPKHGYENTLTDDQL